MFLNTEPVASDRQDAARVLHARPRRESDHPGPIYPRPIYPEPTGEFLPAHDEACVARADRYLRCQTCGYAITRDRDRIRVRDSHEHRCTNPHGIEYRIGCLRQAPGVMETGAETLEYTWFAGYRWRSVLCGGCRTHLGWGFRGQQGDRFRGLILDRLIAPR